MEKCIFSEKFNLLQIRKNVDFYVAKNSFLPKILFWRSAASITYIIRVSTVCAKAAEPSNVTNLTRSDQKKLEATASTEPERKI